MAARRLRFVTLVALALGLGLEIGAPPWASDRTQRAYLGPKKPQQSWVPSRPRPASVLWAVGDGADRGQGGLEVARMIDSQRVHRFLYLGDVYETGTASEFETNYRPLFGRFDRIAAPTIGNHEWANRSAGYLPYWSRVSGRPARMRYAFATSGWQIISLDSMAPLVDAQAREQGLASDARSGQTAWLRRRLARTPRFGDCRIAFMHHPRFSAGSHGDSPHLAPIWKALAGRARLAIAGHDHDMQRFRPVGGVVQLVSGAGGHALRPVDEQDPRLAFAAEARPGALRLGLRPGRARLSFVAADGTTLDRSTLRCRQRQVQKKR